MPGLRTSTGFHSKERTMKYVIIIPDGCADEPIDALGGKTPLQAASLPTMDSLAKVGMVAEANNIIRFSFDSV